MKVLAVPQVTDLGGAAWLHRRNNTPGVEPDQEQGHVSYCGTTQVVAPLLHERDMYLAWSLKRSKAVNGINRVVGVVGKGHLRGVLYHLTHPEASGSLRCEPTRNGTRC